MRDDMHTARKKLWQAARVIVQQRGLTLDACADQTAVIGGHMRQPRDARRPQHLSAIFAFRLHRHAFGRQCPHQRVAGVAGVDQTA